MLVLTWNLFHGRSLPPSPRALSREFAEMLASFSWDVALLQEVPPWWPPQLARQAGAEQRTALTSRNAALAVRRAVAERWPELAKSNGGGANTILARVPIVDYRSVRMRVLPERRVAQLARLQGGACVANYHASTRVPLAEQELMRLWRLTREFAGTAPFVLGGDLNLREPAAPDDAAHVARRDVDHVFAVGLPGAATPRVLEHRVTLRGGGASVELSDHPPLLVEV